MPGPQTVRKSVRYNAAAVEAVNTLFGRNRFSRVANRALLDFLRRKKRRCEDLALQKWLNGRSPEQVAEDGELVKIASHSALRVLESERK